MPGKNPPSSKSNVELGHRKALDALFLLARGCQPALDTGALLDGILNCLLSIFKADRGFILLARTPGDSASTSQPELVPAVVKKVDLAGSDRFSSTVAREVFSRGEPILVPNVDGDRRFGNRSSVVSSGLQWILSAPLLASGTPIGVIYLDSRAVGKPFSDEDLQLLQAAGEHVVVALENAREKDELRVRAEKLRGLVKQEVRREFDTSAIVGKSQALRQIMASIALLAREDTSVLILGESGTGKELVARALHDQSGRNARPFIAVNCMALASGTLESELFGHEKGAFTGAGERHAGRFELADGGTLFLDEIGELDPQVQVKLLRVLQERTVQRVGSARSVPVDVRLVCATHCDLKQAVAQGRFRQDLYYRISVFPIELPPLRDRAEDIGPLVLHFIELFSGRMRRRIAGIEPRALETLESYSWPGNIRELRNVIERAFVLERGDRITCASLPIDLAPVRVPASTPKLDAVRGLTLAAARESFERALILDCMERHGHSITLAAKELDVPRSTIYRKLEALGLRNDPDTDR